MELVYPCPWVHSLGRQKGKVPANLRRMATRKPKSPSRSAVSSGRKNIVQSAKKVGRPRAKHSSPDYVQMSVYIHKRVRSRVKMRLFEISGEFSALVESLLQDWLDTQK